MAALEGIGETEREDGTKIASWHGAHGGEAVSTSGNHDPYAVRAVSREGRPEGVSMPEARETKSLAVLIDADNTSAKHVQPIFDEIVQLGEANVRRIYGDFSGTRLSGWDKAIQSLAILQQQQRSNSKGKNASDIALVIDAMDLMYKRNPSPLSPDTHGGRAGAAAAAPGCRRRAACAATR